jgi:hypothetical protein
MWSFFKPEKIKNTNKYRVNTFGFYSLNGNSVIEFMEHSRKEEVANFLKLIRRENRDKTIIVVLDNFRSHRSYYETIIRHNLSWPYNKARFTLFEMDINRMFAHSFNKGFTF